MSKILDGLPEEGTITANDEALLATKIQKHQSEDDKNNLVLHNMREGVRYGMGFSKCRLPEGEILSVVYTALLKAAKNFKPGGIRFFAYAKPYVRGEICSLWRSFDVVKNASRHETEQPEDTHDAYFQQQAAADQNPDFRTDPYDDIDDSCKIMPEVENPDFKGIDLREKWSIVEPVIEKYLNEREQMIVKLVYIGGFTFDTISKKLVPTITRAAVQHTHARALRKIRAALPKTGALL